MFGLSGDMSHTLVTLTGVQRGRRTRTPGTGNNVSRSNVAATRCEAWGWEKSWLMFHCRMGPETLWSPEPRAQLVKKKPSSVPGWQARLHVGGVRGGSHGRTVTALATRTRGHGWRGDNSGTTAMYIWAPFDSRAGCAPAPGFNYKCRGRKSEECGWHASLALGCVSRVNDACHAMTQGRGLGWKRTGGELRKEEGVAGDIPCRRLLCRSRRSRGTCRRLVRTA